MRIKMAQEAFDAALKAAIEVNQRRVSQSSQSSHDFPQVILPQENLISCLHEMSKIMNDMFTLLKEYALKRAFSVEYKNSWSEILALHRSLSIKYSDEGLKQEEERRSNIASEKALAQEPEEQKALALERERYRVEQEKQLLQEGLKQEQLLERQLAELRSKNASLQNK